MVNQGDVVGLLTVGSKASPKDEVLGKGEEGQKQLTLVKEEGEKGLSAFFAKENSAFKAQLDENGLPPMPVGLHRPTSTGTKRYVIEEEQTYGGE